MKANQASSHRPGRVSGRASHEEVTMAKSKIRETKQLPRDDWGAFFGTLSNESRGQTIEVEVIGEAVGDQPLFSGPLTAIDYDPAGKGDDFVITIGDEAAEHVVRSPSEVWLARSENGEIEFIEILNAAGDKTIVSL